MIKELTELHSKIKELKGKNSIKVNILNSIDYLIKFIETSPGIIGTSKIEDKIAIIRSNIVSPWLSLEKGLIDEVRELLDRYTDKYINLIPVEEEECKIEDTKSELSLFPEQVTVQMPHRLKRLFIDVVPMKGDVSYLPIGPIHHYCIVYKVVGDVSYVIPLTTTTGIFEGYTLEKSRFFKGTAIISLSQFPTSLVSEKFVMPYDNKSEFRNICKTLEEQLFKILPRQKKKK